MVKRRMGRKRKSTMTVPSPSFFKVVLGDHPEKQLRIPPAFIKHFNREIPNESILRSSSGKVWNVEVKTVDNNLFFQNGWADFVKGNLIELGDFLVFDYRGNSEFDVKVFGKNGCLKEEGPMEKNVDESTSDEENEEQKKEREEFTKNTGTYQCSSSKGKQKKQLRTPDNTKCPSYSATRGERRLNNMDLPSYRFRTLWWRIYAWWEVMDPTVRELIDQSPFGHFMKIPPLRTSGNFLGAVAERWNGDTNTFHLPFGEATITPMDFFMLTGLPVDGTPVVTQKTPDDDRIRELIGDLPRRSSNTAYIRWIIENFKGSVISTQKERVQHARAFIWALLGGVILCNGSDRVQLCYLELLAEFPHNRYDWGGAAYAHLLHSLRRVTSHPSKKNVSIGGFAVTIQCWFYEHFPALFPLLETPAPTFPCITKWAALARVQTITPNGFTIIQSGLDSLKRRKFIADPYCQSEFRALPEAVHASFLSAHRVIFRCGARFEWYLGERVRTQFGKDLSVPYDPKIKYPVKLSNEEYIQLRATLKPESEFLNRRSNKYKEWYQSQGQPACHNVSHAHKLPASTSQLSRDELIEMLAASQRIIEHQGLHYEKELADDMRRTQTGENNDEDEDEDEDDDEDDDDDDDDEYEDED